MWSLGRNEKECGTVAPTFSHSEPWCRERVSGWSVYNVLEGSVVRNGLPGNNVPGTLLGRNERTPWFPLASAELELCAWNPDVCPLVEFLRAVVLSAEWTLLNQAFQIAGVVALVDMEDFHLNHLLHYTPSEIRRAIKLVQECYPVRLRGIYVLNNPPVFQLFYALVKLVLKPKLQRRIHIIGRDYEKLHKLIPRERLPQEYDGTLEKYDYDDLERKFLSQENFFVELGSYGYQ